MDSGFNKENMALLQRTGQLPTVSEPYFVLKGLNCYF